MKIKHVLLANKKIIKLYVAFVLLTCAVVLSGITPMYILDNPGFETTRLSSIMSYTEVFLPIMISSAVICINCNLLKKHDRAFNISLNKSFETSIAINTVMLSTLFMLLGTPYIISVLYRMSLIGHFDIAHIAIIIMNSFLSATFLSVFGSFVTVLVYETGYVFSALSFIVLLDFFTKGRFSRLLTLFPMRFRNDFDDAGLYINRAAYVVMIIILSVLNVIALKKINSLRE